VSCRPNCSVALARLQWQSSWRCQPWRSAAAVDLVAVASTVDLVAAVSTVGSAAVECISVVAGSAAAVSVAAWLAAWLPAGACSSPVETALLPHPFAGQRFAVNRFNNFGFRNRFNNFALRNRFFFRHHHFRNFAFFGAPFFEYGAWPYDYDYAAYGGCWRQVWTSYDWQWVNVCNGYDYYGNNGY
jgi:hypothetical protein